MLAPFPSLSTLFWVKAGIAHCTAKTVCSFSYNLQQSLMPNVPVHHLKSDVVGWWTGPHIIDATHWRAMKSMDMLLDPEQKVCC